MQVIRKLRNKVRTYRWFHEDHVSDEAPVIVGGCSRSGTALMRAILAAHSRICCGAESNLFTVPYMPQTSRRCIAALARKYDLAEDDVWAMVAGCASHVEFVDRFFDHYRRRVGRPVWADQTPDNVLRLGYIFKHWPRARFVHVIRDGRDTVCSLRAHPRGGAVGGARTREPVSGCLERWLASVRAGLAYRSQPSYYEVRYEDLVNHRETTLRELVSFLGLPWEDDLLDHQPAEAPGRWRSDLTPAEQDYVHERAGDLLTLLGYPMPA